MHRDLAMKLTGVALSALVIAIGCTSIQVQPIDSSLAPKHICIQDNPAVQVADFVDVVRARLAYHNITTSVFFRDSPMECEYVLTYTALRSWDLASFMSHAEVYLSHGGRQIASGTFHLRGKGGYALTKYNSTKQKMDPVIDQLIGNAPSTRTAR